MYIKVFICNMYNMNLTYSAKTYDIPWFATDIFATSCISTILMVFVCCACYNARVRQLQLRASTSHEML